MSGTAVAHAATTLYFRSVCCDHFVRACCAISGTVVAYVATSYYALAMRCPVLAQGARALPCAWY
eukprot:1609299-Rhodomonas_salina.4